MNGDGHTDHAGPSLPPTVMGYEMVQGVHTWTVPARNCTVRVTAMDDAPCVNVDAPEHVALNEAEVRALTAALMSAWARVTS